MMKRLQALLGKWGDKIRMYTFEKGFACDGCGRELFDYPKRRFCMTCEARLERNDERFCEKCGRRTVAEGVCLNCKKAKPQFTRALSPFVYQGYICSLINRFKNGERVFVCYFAEKMADCLLKNLPTVSALKEIKSQNAPPMYELSEAEGEPILLLPVPMTRADQRKRGFNQALELCKRVQEELTKRCVSVELDNEILLKVKQTPPQKQRSFFERTKNLEGAFHVHKRKKCKDRTVLLIDDIMTTGATASECASRLLGAGAKEVIFLSVASLAEVK